MVKLAESSMPAVQLAMTEVDLNEGALLLRAVTGCYIFSAKLLKLLLANLATGVLKAEHGRLHTELSVTL